MSRLTWKCNECILWNMHCTIRTGNCWPRPPPSSVQAMHNCAPAGKPALVARETRFWAMNKGDSVVKQSNNRRYGVGAYVLAFLVMLFSTGPLNDAYGDYGVWCTNRSRNCTQACHFWYAYEIRNITPDIGADCNQGATLIPVSGFCGHKYEYSIWGCSVWLGGYGTRSSTNCDPPA